MEYIKIAKVSNVVLHRRGTATEGTLHLTTHHLIFESPQLSTEFWFPYPLIYGVHKNPGSTLLSKLTSTNQIQLEGTDSQNYRLYQGKDLWSFVNIKIIGKDYVVFSLDFGSDLHLQARKVYESILNLTVVGNINKLYAFIYMSNNLERKLPAPNSWEIYDPVREFQRQGLDHNDESCPWRLSMINEQYEFCPTYPSQLFVPRSTSDTLLQHASKFRSQKRIPVLTYHHKATDCNILRSSQPLPGLINQRSIQDEKLVWECFSSFFNTDIKRTKHVIVDARPRTNALAQMALGGGTENMDNYNFFLADSNLGVDNNIKLPTVTRLFLGIDNIHIVSNTAAYMTEIICQAGDLNLPLEQNLIKSQKFTNWLKLNTLILKSVDMLLKSMIFNHSNVLVHCSDGWDRTSQVVSLLEMCLDPFYRTYEGFMILVEKDWCSFGHRFLERSGHLNSDVRFHDNTMHSLFNDGDTNGDSFDMDQDDYGEDDGGDDEDTNLINISKISKKFNNNFKLNKKSLKFVSPVFQQFLDCVYQLLTQNPDLFEFNERFLRRLIYHLYSCQYGTFLSNNEKEKFQQDLPNKTKSVWDYFRSRKKQFINPNFVQRDNSVKDDEEVAEDEKVEWISPDLKKIQWWWQLYGKKDSEMNDELRHKKGSSSLPMDKNTKEHCNSDGSKGLNLSIFGFDMFNRK
ncbi:phosphatidylinositol-3-phosphatase YMR1 [Saccharomyces eubayanus]|uniref:phosphatidylinositol-3-phosphatase YMR1 n=1 Tax=Saccharomyces eubayanus TaxID=1080349 RepID=UPI0006C37D11|nr:YMR1-like protein [Saccharomyces eubayanus]KOG98691.1 YMR1-like protein [Saccharomyces eubayanus]